MKSEIQEFYRDKSIFLTGASGFFGQIIIEKLLRCCDVKAIYVLIRNKKGDSWKERLGKMFEDQLYDTLKVQKPDFMDKIIGIPGDLILENFGISDKDMKVLHDNVNIVLHGAATVRFDEKLSFALNINVKGTETLINICKEMKYLKSFVYLSTAFSNCNHFEIEEKFYKPKIPAKGLLNLMNSFDEEILNRISGDIIEGFPNTYTFTKHIAEDLLMNYADKLPIAIFRPAIVMPTSKEPVTGWINNQYGPVGLMYGISVGVIHTFYLDKNVTNPIVPVDMAVNSLLAIAWDVAQEKHKSSPIYNFASTKNNRLTWGKFSEISLNAAANFPVSYCYWYYAFETTSNMFMLKIMHFCYHVIPALFVDSFLTLSGSKIRLLKIYRKISKLYNLLGFFTTNHFSWEENNVKALWSQMNSKDKEIFYFDLETLDWHSYLYKSLLGMRFYVAKDDSSTIPASIKRQKFLKVLHYSVVYFIRISLLLLFAFVLWKYLG